MTSTHRSNCWKHCRDIPGDKDSVICNYCEHTYKVKGQAKSMNSMKVHLLDAHQVDWKSEPDKSKFTLSCRDTTPFITKPRITMENLAEIFIEGNFSNTVASNRLFNKYFGRILPPNVNRLAISKAKIELAKLKDKERATRLNKKTVTMFIDGWKQFSTDWFNIICNSEYICSFELVVREEKETMRNILKDKVEKIETDNNCVILAIVTDNTNKATAPIKLLSDVLNIMPICCISHSIQLMHTVWISSQNSLQ